MSDRIEAAFEPLHITLARLRLLTHLIGDDLTLSESERAELSLWLRDLVSTAQDQAIEAEQVASTPAKEAE